MKPALLTALVAALAGWATASQGQPYFVEQVDDVALVLVDLGSVEKVEGAVRYTSIVIYAYPAPIGPLDVHQTHSKTLMDCSASGFWEEETRHLDESGRLLPRGGPFTSNARTDFQDNWQAADTRQRLCFGVDDGSQLVSDLRRAQRAYALTIAEDEASKPPFDLNRPMTGSGYIKHPFWDAFTERFYRYLTAGLV